MNATPVQKQDIDYSFLTPEELLDLYRKGDEYAFCELVSVMGDRLFGFLRRFVGEYHLAEDVYQSVLVKIAVNAEKYDGRARLQTWVFRMARNAAIDALRARNRKNETQLEKRENEEGGCPLERIVSKELPPDDKLTIAELGRRIGLAVEALPEDQKEVFLLREDADLTFDEIGQVLGCGKETAKSRMRYAIKRLRDALGKEARLYGLLSGL